MTEPLPDRNDYIRAVRAIMASIDFCADDISRAIHTHPAPVNDGGARARALSIARTQIELGAAMLTRALTL